MSDTADVNDAEAEATPPAADAPKAAAAKFAPAAVVSEPASTSAPARAGKAKPIQKKPAATKPAKTKPVKTKPIRAVRKPAPAVKESTMNDTIKTITDKTKTIFADANDRTKGAWEKGARAFEDAGEFHKGNLEAIVESSKIAAKGAEDIARYSVDYAKGTVEKANANVRKLAAVKSPTEFFQLQTEFAREAMDAVAQESAKFTENYLKLLGSIAQPYQNRFAVAAEKVKAAA